MCVPVYQQSKDITQWKGRHCTSSNFYWCTSLKTICVVEDPCAHTAVLEDSGDKMRAEEKMFARATLMDE